MNTQNLVSTYPIERIRADFPQLRRTVYDDKPLIFLDSAATTLKPQSVIDRITSFYAEDYGTVRRGVYWLSQNATSLYENVRKQAKDFLGAADEREIIFVRGVTEAMNLIATGYGRKFLEPGDEIIVSQMEHHANIVSWQLIKDTGVILRAAPMDDRGVIDLEALGNMLGPKTKIVSIVHVSNGLGTINPVKRIAKMAHDVGAIMIVDGAQSACHLPIDVQDIGCDFYACSGHKILGPSGVGMLYGRYELLESMNPYQGGGEMIDTVTFDETTFDVPPHRFEAGTPPFAQVIGLGAALEYLNEIGMDAVAAWDHHIQQYAESRLRDIPGLRVYGEAPEKSGLVAFTIDGAHPLDIGTILDREGICIRVGQHCVQPVMDHFNISATARASFGVYTTTQDIDALIEGLNTVLELMG